MIENAAETDIISMQQGYYSLAEVKETASSRLKSNGKTSTSR